MQSRCRHDARAGAAFDKHKLHKDVATHVKQGFDAKYPPADNKATSGVYHCIVGSDFAVSVTHETHFSCFWRCRPPPAARLRRPS